MRALLSFCLRHPVSRSLRSPAARSWLGRSKPLLPKAVYGPQTDFLQKPAENKPGFPVTFKVISSHVYRGRQI
jgi:hypothetical protein